MQSVMVLGRQPNLGLAELESLYGADKVIAAGNHAAIVNVDPCLLAYERLGGSVKFCKMLTTLNTTNWPEIEQFLLKSSPDHSKQMPNGKMQLGLSVIGLDINVRKLSETGLKLKKAIREETGRSVRLIPNKSLDLNSAQIIHNRLTGPNGWELVFIVDGKQTIVAQTVKVQDIEAYARRDQNRPKRDVRVGMLPPKLAQIIINLAVGKLPPEKLQSICDISAGQKIPRPNLGQNILDPFCGTGVIAQESYLMGYGVYGTDLEQRMVDFTIENMLWLSKDFDRENAKLQFTSADATSYHWPYNFDFVASEVYLGRPFTTMPKPEILDHTVTDCNLIIKKFLHNLHSQTTSGFRLCLAVPAWQTQAGRFQHLPLIDQISDLGYNLVSFKHVRDEDLMYYRADQIVARQLLVITRK